jgi:hypothetical protein
VRFRIPLRNARLLMTIYRGSRFAEYETLLDVETEDCPLKDVVEHLVYWRKARVVDVVSLKGTYALSAKFDTTRYRSPLLSLPLSLTSPRWNQARSPRPHFSVNVPDPPPPAHSSLPDSSNRTLLDPHSLPHLPPRNLLPGARLAPAPRDRFETADLRSTRRER